MPIELQQGDSTPLLVEGVFCSSRSLDAVNHAIILLAKAGGLAGAGTGLVVLPTSQSTPTIHMIIDCPIPPNMNWDAGQWTIKINVTASNAGGTNLLDECRICRVNSLGVSQESIGNATALAIAMGATGVFTFNVTTTAPISKVVPGDRIALILAFTNTSSMSAANLTFTFNQIITCPFNPAPSKLGLPSIRMF